MLPCSKPHIPARLISPEFPHLSDNCIIWTSYEARANVYRKDCHTTPRSKTWHWGSERGTNARQVAGMKSKVCLPTKGSMIPSYAQAWLLQTQQKTNHAGLATQKHTAQKPLYNRIQPCFLELCSIGWWNCQARLRQAYFVSKVLIPPTAATHWSAKGDG